MTRYAVIGLGAVGGLYGTRLAAAGHEVHFIVRSSADQIRQSGIHLTSVAGDVHLDKPSVFDASTGVSDVPEVDAVVIALKTTANRALTELLPALVGNGATVIVLQNGLGAEAAIAEIAPRSVVLGGLCFVCSQKEGPGRINHIDYGAVTVGEWLPSEEPAGVTENVSSFVTDLESAGVRAVESGDLMVSRWKKLCWNIPYNGLSVVLNEGTDTINAHASTRSLVSDLMEEVRAGCLASTGRTIDSAFVDKMLIDTDAMTPYAPSMKLDAVAGRALELEAIYRNPLRAAREGGVSMVRTEMLLRQLELIDDRRISSDPSRGTRTK